MAAMSWRDDMRARARARWYADVKDTPEYLEDQAIARARATDAIEGLGYTRARAAQAVREYAAASRDTMLGPDWDRFVTLVSNVGLVRPGPVTGKAAQLQARRKGTTRR